MTFACILLAYHVYIVSDLKRHVLRTKQTSHVLSIISNLEFVVFVINSICLAVFAVQKYVILFISSAMCTIQIHETLEISLLSPSKKSKDIF